MWEEEYNNSEIGEQMERGGVTAVGEVSCQRKQGLGGQTTKERTWHTAGSMHV